MSNQFDSTAGTCVALVRSARKDILSCTSRLYRRSGSCRLFLDSADNDTVSDAQRTRHAAWQATGVGEKRDPVVSTQPDRAEGERRLPGRRPSNRLPFVRVCARPSFRSFDAVIRDASSDGLGLVVPCCFEPGTVLAIQLQAREAGFSGVLTGRVVHATPLPDGTWVVGCLLSRPLTEDELLGLL